MAGKTDRMFGHIGGNKGAGFTLAKAYPSLRRPIRIRGNDVWTRGVVLRWTNGGEPGTEKLIR